MPSKGAPSSRDTRDTRDTHDTHDTRDTTRYDLDYKAAGRRTCDVGWSEGQ